MRIYLAKLFSLLSIVRRISSRLKAIPKMATVCSGALIEIFYTHTYMRTTLMVAFLDLQCQPDWKWSSPGFFWTFNFWDSDVFNQAGVWLLALVAVAEAVRHIRLLQVNHGEQLDGGVDGAESEDKIEKMRSQVELTLPHGSMISRSVFAKVHS